MTRTPQATEQLAALAIHLAERREHLLTAWREAAEADPELATVSALSRSQFNDHIPEVLDAFERRLRGQQAQATTDQNQRAAEHGMHRWRHGYNQRQVMREWGHLQLCLVDELEAYAGAHTDLDPAVMPTARRELAQLFSEGVVESASQYAHLQQVEAAGRLQDLQQAFVQVKEVQRRRADMWREAAHDLRNNIGVVKNVTAVLNSDVTEEMRDQFLAMVQRAVDAMHRLLEDLMSLTRLEAGQEQRHVVAFDAGNMLTELCANLEPMAAERGLFLKAAGPVALPVEGDSVKTRRIAQNLLFNALKYTEQGGVKVTWGEAPGLESERWLLCVQDTGPGIDDGLVPPLAHSLKEATDEARAVEIKAEQAGDPNAQPERAPTLASQSEHRSQPPGEGIGLSIVKRLCELLDASLDLETKRGQGSTFRVAFPRRYESPAKPGT